MPKLRNGYFSVISLLDYPFTCIFACFNALHSGLAKVVAMLSQLKPQLSKADINILFVWFKVLHPGQQLWSYQDGQFT